MYCKALLESLISPFLKFLGIIKGTLLGDVSNDHVRFELKLLLVPSVVLSL